jgi:hypothetical protein
MKKLLVLTGLVTVLAFAAASASSGAPASTFTASTSFPIELLVFIPCANGGAGEEVLLSGNLHDLFHVTINDNSIHVKVHDQPQGISGTGQVTGVKYQATGVTQDEFKTSFGSEETFVNNFRIIGQGPGNNFLVHDNFHITVNANGTVTAFHDNFRADCK